MWIGFDWLGLPDPAADALGVGRYALRLLDATGATAGPRRPIVYVAKGATARPDRGEVVELAPDRSPLSRRTRSARQRLVDDNRDSLDWLVVIDPMAASPLGPAPSQGLVSSPKLAAFLPRWPDADDLTDPARRTRLRQLESLARYDLIFTPGEALAGVVRERLHLAADRVIPLGPLCDRSRFRRDPESHVGRLTREFLCARGIRSAYILHEVAEPTGLAEIIGAYAGLPGSIRLRYRLVLAGRPEHLSEAENLAFGLGVADRLVTLSGLAPADRMRLLSSASLCLSPGGRERLLQAEVESLAMAIPIVAADTPGHREWLGEAASYVTPGLVGPLSGRIADLLDAPDDRAALSLAGLDRADHLDEAAVASRVRDALASTSPRSGLARVVEGLGLRPKPRLAYFPALSDDGIRGRASLAAVVAPLTDTLAVDVFVEPGSRLLDSPIPGSFGLFSAREFARRDGVSAYASVLYEIGESSDIDVQMDRIRDRPGTVVVHDRVWLPPASFATLPADRLKPSPTIDPEANRRWAERLARRILATGSHLIVTSRWASDRVAPFADNQADRIRVLPWGIGEEAGGPGLREWTRQRLQMSEGELLVIQCGPASGDDPEMLRTLVVSQDRLDGRSDPAWDSTTRSVSAGNRAEWLELVAGADLAIHPGSDPLRPERGLALLDLMKAGVPTIVPDTDLPRGVVEPLPKPADLDSFADAVRTLARDPARRRTIGAAARDYAAGTLPAGESPGRLLGALESSASAREDPREVRRRWRESASHGHADLRRQVAMTWAEGRPR